MPGHNEVASLRTVWRSDTTQAFLASLQVRGRAFYATVSVTHHSPFLELENPPGIAKSIRLS